MFCLTLNINRLVYVDWTFYFDNQRKPFEVEVLERYRHFEFQECCKERHLKSNKVDFIEINGHEG